MSSSGRRSRPTRSVGTTGALASCGSSRLRAIACFIRSCWYSRLLCEVISDCLSVATAESEFTTSSGASVPICNCLRLSLASCVDCVTARSLACSSS